MSNLQRGIFGGSSPADVRLVLVGNIGCGKTSTGDNILGEQSTLVPGGTRSCQQRQGVCEGKNVTLVEAPRWFWVGGKMEESVKEETERAMTLVEPGLHAVLLLIPVNQFTEMEGRIPAALKEMFGDKVLDHTLVLLTCADYLMRMSVQDYVQKEQAGLRQLIEDCGGRYHAINNRQWQNREQVRQLLDKVDNMVKQNGMFHRKTAQDREMERGVEEKKQELMEFYKTQRENVSSATGTDTKPQTSVNRGEERIASSPLSRREGRMETMTDVSQVSNSLYSVPSAEKRSYLEEYNKKKVLSAASSRQNKEGAELSQIPEVKSPERQTSTLHHRINSSEDRPQETSSASAPGAPVFSSSPPPSSPSSSSHFSSVSPSTELRLVLLGRSGSGKSAAGNAILGREEFESYPESLTAITRECEKKKASVEGRRVVVVDTPDWFNSEKTPEEIRAQISSCVTLSSPGPHAFLMCVPLDQPAKTELQALRALESVFGPDAVRRHTIVLFTYTDRLKEAGKAGNNSVEAYIAGQRSDLLKIVEKCGDRFHIADADGGPRQRANVVELLDKVQQLVEEAGGRCYSSPAFQEAEMRLRERQLEIARQRKGDKSEGERAQDARQPGGSQKPVLYPYMQPLAEADEEQVREDEMEKTRAEAEKSVRTMNIESLPQVALSSVSPSLLSSVLEKVSGGSKNWTQMLSDSSVWVNDKARRVRNSPVWGTVGSEAQNLQKRVSKLVGDRVPKVVVDGSAWVGSGAKAAADGSMRVSSSVGAGAKSLAQSPMWGKMGSGAKSGAKLVAQNSVRLGSGIGSGAKKVAQSPVWGKVGSGAKARAKMVADSSVWEKIGTAAKKAPKVVVAGALIGLVLGVLLGGAIGGAVGAVAGSAVSEVGRRKLGKQSALEKAEEAAHNVARREEDSTDALLKRAEKALKTE